MCTAYVPLKKSPQNHMGGNTYKHKKPTPKTPTHTHQPVHPPTHPKQCAPIYCLLASLKLASASKRSISEIYAR